MQMAVATDSAAQPVPRLVLVDGSGYIFRAYHALPPLTRPDGTPVGAVYGFTSMLMKTLESLHATHVAVIFDAARHTFRNEIYPSYKANRAETPEDLIPQFPIVREATRSLNIPSIEMDHYEADDLIASYAKAAVAKGMDVMVVSSDKDLMQLISERVCLYDPMKQREIRAEQVLEKFGVPPEKVIEVQALIGDSVDNVPGVPGIGPKTAAELIQAFGTLDEVLARAGEIKQQKRRESLIEFAPQARISYELVKLKHDVPLPVPLEELVCKEPDPATLIGFLQAQNFKSMTQKMQQRYGAYAAADTPEVVAAPPVRTHYSLVRDEATLRQWVAKAQAAGVVAVDTETTGLLPMQAGLVGVSLSVTAGEACYIPLAHVQEVIAKAASQGSLFGDEDTASATTALQRVEGQLEASQALAILKPMLEDPAVLKVGQNIKYDALMFRRLGIDVSPVDDSMLLSYVLSAGKNLHNMDDLAQQHLGHKTISFKDVVGTGKAQIGFAQVPLERACDYAAEDADITLRLYQTLKRQVVEAKLLTVYESIERPLIDVIVAMEAAGIKADPHFLRQLSAEFELQINQLEKTIHELAGRSFNIASPKQLGDILFDEMKLSGGKKSSKTGAYSTGAEVLEELAAQGHVICEKVLQWRQLSKLKSTYTDALVEQINPQTGRIHTSFSMAVTTTGRLSSSDPNLQNIPIRSTEGKRIREAFVAEEGMRLISADYSQIELRLLAHVAQIEVLQQAFRDGADIHAATASQMFGVPQSQVDSELRRRAKSINFGIIYGISAHGLAAQLGISRTEAASYIEAYFAKYPGIKDYMEQTKAFAHTHGYVATLFGRRIHVPEINSSNPNMRAFQERAAINAPLQGTAADIIKKAMVRVHEELKAHFPDARLLLQVHDELIVECPAAQAEAVAARVKAVMSGAAHLSVPLLVEAGIGHNWGEIH